MIINNKKNKIITGIDIGTTKIAIIIAEKTNDSINILGFGESQSKGLRRGVVIDVNDTASSIEKALNSPLLDDNNIKGAKNILINIS